MDNKLLLVKNFIDNYKSNSSIDFMQNTNNLNEILSSELNQSQKAKNPRVIFLEEDNISTPMKISGNNICINKTRITAIHRHSIDCNSIFNSDWLWGFYKNEKTRANKNAEEIYLLNYIENAKETNNLLSLSNIGSIRTTEFELLECVYIGQSEFLQNEQKLSFTKETIKEASTRNIIGIFSIIYDLLLQKSKNTGIKPKITPAQLNTKYYSISKLETIQNSLFMYDINLTLHIVNTSPFLKQENKTNISNGIWEDYLSLYNNVCQNNKNELFAFFNNLFHLRKDLIISDLKEKANSIIQITNKAREKLTALNDPYLTFN